MKIHSGNEFSIVRLASQVVLDEVQRDHLQQLCSQLPDWHQVYQLSIFHKVFPLVFNNLLRYVSAQLPSDFRKQSQATLFQNRTRNLKMVQCLLACLRQLNESGVMAMPFKGPIFAICVYGDVSLKYFNDLDLLIRQEDVVKAVEILRREGFLPLCALDSAQLKRLAQTDNEIPLIHNKSGICIDLQWELTGGFCSHRLRYEDLQKEQQELNVFQHKIITFGDEDLFVYLCLHGTQHLWQEFDHVCCMHELLRKKKKIVWDRLLEKSRSLGMEKAFQVGVHLLGSFYANTVPASVTLEKEREKGVTSLARIIIERYNLPVHQEGQPVELNRRFNSMQFRFLRGWRKKLRYALHLLFVPTRYDWQCMPLPAMLAVCYYLLRPIRLAISATCTTMKQLLHLFYRK